MKGVITNPPIARIYMNSWDEIYDFIKMIRPVCSKISKDRYRRDHIQLTIKWDGKPHRYDIYLNKYKEAKEEIGQLKGEVADKIFLF